MEKRSAIAVRVPASSANLGPGFDAVAVAVGLYLKCTVRTSEEGVKIRASGTDCDEIPGDDSNLVWRAFVRLAGAVKNAELEIVNEIPLGRGLGSSAAAVLAGLALGNEWSGGKRGREEMIELASEMEGHPDNVAAAARGGLVVSCQAEDGRVLSVRCPLQAGLEIVVVVPELQLSTAAARAALPKQYSRGDAVFNVQRTALLLAALGEGRDELFAEAMRDRLHQPYRAPLVPGFAEILKLRDVPGLLGLALSGAGPSVVAFCRGNAAEAGERIAACFRAQKIEAKVHRLPIDQEGLRVERIAG